MRATTALPFLSALITAALGLSNLAAAQTAAAPAATAPKVDLARLDYGLRARELGPGAWVVEGANADFSVPNGCNIINTGFFATGAGVVVVNTGTSTKYGEQLRALIARTTSEPVVQVIHLNLHPDYFLGNQGFADVPRLATPTTRAGMAREASAYETNLYRLCGDWMKATEALLPEQDLDVPATGRRWTVGGREFELHELSGHTDSDLVLIDRRSGVAFVGGLAFADRIPTTPHARVGPWLASLDRLDALLQASGVRTVVPSHGPVRSDRQALAQTGRYLRWLDASFTAWAREGWDMNEVLRAPVPAEYRGWAAFDTEWVRNIAHLYPVYERAVLSAGRAAGR
ncbi:MAG TPA: quinoprotein relay system zinc metallohydrolase 1 [Burkholderiaceae bacterium]|nr:quinoprotein relay system zinc metallohydrolase 1 [Burkholderiaceae bacterium]